MDERRSPAFCICIENDSQMHKVNRFSNVPALSTQTSGSSAAIYFSHKEVDNFRGFI